MKDAATVFVIDDNSAVRDAIRWMVEEVGLRVKTFGTANEFLDELDLDSYGCLVLDVRMPGMSGLDLQEHMAEMGVTLPVIVITGHGDVPMAVRSMKSGAFEFMQKPFNDQDLIDCIYAAINKHGDILAARNLSAEASKRLSLLARREHEVLQLMLEGMPSKGIANSLCISVRTVEGHRAGIMGKMQANSVAQLVEYCHSAEHI